MSTPLTPLRRRRRFCFVGGGARSGKSGLAHRLALESGPRRTFIATAQPLDDEMHRRILRHQQERGQDFRRTLEVPLDLPDTLRRDCATPGDDDVILIDCLTLWISNLLLLLPDPADIQLRVADLRDAIDACPASVVLVSNEVGMGIVPMNALARRFRDETGWAHQTLAAAADEVYFGALGLMLRLKPGPVTPV